MVKMGERASMEKMGTLLCTTQVKFCHTNTMLVLKRKRELQNFHHGDQKLVTNNY